MLDLTPRQEEILSILQARHDEGQLPPSRRELADALGIRNVSAVQNHLERIEKKGFITMDYRGRPLI